MKTYLALVWLLMIVFLSYSGDTFSQVSMAVQLPPVGVLMKSQLWNIMLINGGTRPVSIRIVFRMLDAGNSQPILAASTQSIILKPGGQQLQVKDFAPLQYEFLSSSIDKRDNGMLSPGNYIACYTVMLDNEKNFQPAVEDCIPFVVEPVSPPLLNYPEDSAVLDSRLPQFSWIPPAPLNLFTDLNYELRVVEVLPNQSFAESVQQNIPVYRAIGLRNSFNSYPSGGTALDTGKTYVWMVIANNGKQFAAQTDIRSFTLNKGDSINHTSLAFVQLRKSLDGAVVTTMNPLKFIYNNESADKQASYEVISLEDDHRVMHGTIDVQRGQNMLTLALKHVHKDGQYQFRLKNSRREVWRLNFIYRPE
ncbi:hypothetical protein CLV59_1077 [Chitinophaga dinghuensis]|uniref:Uncharacterized protein n=1 Tax=Chitinophaga dinghuensis TaxID=1539050 RepID=A0A327VZM4_9BACT|nr:hypothetical protein [Chitinophaga dinghuensis]RAJ77242.1 hypothetical protein CLV59_1077 [Chitinophaga dinghuensis]